MPTHQERIEGGLYGLLIGDALECPTSSTRPRGFPSPR